MYLSELNVDELTDEQLTHVLFSNIEDDDEKGDCIFVVGSSKAIQYRLPKAVELYQQGRARKILFSGGATWNGNKFPEAIHLKNKAIELGVSENDILIEDRSLNTFENVLASLVVLNRAFFLYNIKRLLVVTNAFHMRRLHLTLKTYMPDWIQFTLCPAEDNNTRKDNWLLSDIGRQRILAECSKLINYVHRGALKDQKVNL